jgi:hypothetical protein
MSLVPSVESKTLGVAEAALTLTALTADNVVLQVTGTFTGTITFEASVDGTNYVAIAMKASTQTTATTLVSTTTTVGVFSLNIQGLPNFRARMSAYTDGSAVVTASLARSNK